MKTLREFIDKTVEMWPKITEQEKNEFCEALATGDVFTLNKVLKKLQKEIKKRENKTN